MELDRMVNIPKLIKNLCSSLLSKCEDSQIPPQIHSFISPSFKSYLREYHMVHKFLRKQDSKHEVADPLYSQQLSGA